MFIGEIEEVGVIEPPSIPEPAPVTIEPSTPDPVEEPVPA